MTRTHHPGIAGINLADMDFFADGTPHEAFAQLRKEAPVSWHQVDAYAGHWALVKHEDVVRVSRDPKTFTSEKGIIVETNPDDPPESHSTILSKMMIYVDPPRHERLRALVNREFTPRAIAGMQGYVEGVVAELLDEVEEQREFDFVSAVAARLPMYVICRLIGTPDEDRPMLSQLFDRSFGSDDPDFQEGEMTPEETRLKVLEELIEYLRSNLLRQKRALADGDIGTMLAGAEIDGDSLSDDEIIAFYFLLLGAGSETTRTAAAAGLNALLERPEQWEMLKADRSLAAPAVEEILRWVSPILGFGRVATVDTEIRGQEIKAGEKVHMWFASANRDEEVFEDSQEFKITRSPNPHLAFGNGTHFCLGSSLSRLELRVLFEALADRLPEIQSAGDLEPLRTLLTPGIKRMPVRLGRE
ncbi:MAG TPA: cytochrome P450 [Solirubrobacterales bacterium]|nr:cytochrome P450 [Solirubrobacterales bacterium]